MITINGVEPNMIANNLTPAFPTHPGEVLKEEIEYRGISLAAYLWTGYIKQMRRASHEGHLILTT